jgi:hypothetical protein
MYAVDIQVKTNVLKLIMVLKTIHLKSKSFFHVQISVL